MVKADIPSHSRESSPEKTVSSVSSVSSASSHSLVSRTSSSASSCPDTATTISTTRESSPDFRLEISIAEYKPPSKANGKKDNNDEKTPISSDSPLFSQPDNPNDSIKQLKHFNRTLKKARSFRAAREKIDKSPGSGEPVRGEWVTFVIRKSLTGRMGWKIMTDNEDMNLRLNKDTIEMVTEKIRDLQFSGETVPDRMTLYIQ